MLNKLLGKRKRGQVDWGTEFKVSLHEHQVDLSTALNEEVRRKVMSRYEHWRTVLMTSHSVISKELDKKQDTFIRESLEQRADTFIFTQLGLL